MVAYLGWALQGCSGKWREFIHTRNTRRGGVHESVQWKISKTIPSERLDWGLTDQVLLNRLQTNSETDSLGSSEGSSR